MPDIALMGGAGLQRRQGLLNRSPSIAHAALPLDALLLQIPQQDGPAFPIHRDGRNTGPDPGTVGIHHIEIGRSPLAAVSLIQGQRGTAYLNVVDAHSSVVWASVPPVAVD